MRWWPWKQEKRESGGNFSDAVLRLIEAQAAGTAASAASTAAVEAAAGSLSRAFASAEVIGPGWVRDAVTGVFLAQCGRDLVLRGESLHVLHVTSMGKVSLLPCSSWHWEGDAHPDTWTCRASVYGPSTSTTKPIPRDGIVWIPWGATPGQPYTGVGPLSWAHTTARLQAEAERSLADESQGPIANLLTLPDDPGDDDDDDNPLGALKAQIAGARGKAVMLETTAAGWGQGPSAKPARDWVPSRLGPSPAESMVMIRKDAFSAMLAACGTPPSLFVDADGTSQREAARRYHGNLVLPLAGLLAAELRERLEVDVSLTFDRYPQDLQGRAAAFAKMVQGGADITHALAVTGLLSEGE